jgi:hypothetical protein
VDAKRFYDEYFSEVITDKQTNDELDEVAMMTANELLTAINDERLRDESIKGSLMTMFILLRKKEMGKAKEQGKEKTKTGSKGTTKNDAMEIGSDSCEASSQSSQRQEKQEKRMRRRDSEETWVLCISMSGL